MSRGHLLSSGGLRGNPVVAPDGREIGRIEDIMLDLEAERIAYAVLSLAGFTAREDRLCAVPMSEFDVDHEGERLVLDVPEERLENAPGLDRAERPQGADRSFGARVYDHFRRPKYW